MAYIPNHLQKYCKITLGWKDLFITECLFDVSKVLILFSDHQKTLRFSQQLVL